METVGMENLSSAAAQGEQAFDPHHANGYNFTGAGPNVQTLEDAARQYSIALAFFQPYSATLHSNAAVGLLVAACRICKQIFTPSLLEHHIDLPTERFKIGELLLSNSETCSYALVECSALQCISGLT